MNTGIWSLSSITKKVRATKSGRSRGLRPQVFQQGRKIFQAIVVSEQEEANAPRELECSGSWIDRHDNWILGFT